MARKTKKAKGRLDKYYHLAKEQGYRSRAAFKLIQLNRKYNFLNTAKAVLDLCAAPGGWLQVCSKYMPVSSILIGVDLDPIKPIPNCTTFQSDITTDKCRSEVKRTLNGWKCDVVLHDGAPNVGTAWVQDAYSQAELVLMSLKLATEFLREGGWFITKVFRSKDYNSLIWVFNQLFRKVEATKPAASRNTSAEIFVVCQGYLAPAKIDPKFLDPKFVFKEIEAPVKINIFDKKQMNRNNRQGYDDDARGLLFKKIPVSQFIDGDDPIQMLAQYHTFDFDESSKFYEALKETTKEIKTLCSDLKVLGKTDFKALLKWRLKMLEHKKDRDGDNEEEQAEDKEEEKGENEEDDEENKVTEELEEKLELLQQRRKAAERRKEKRERKEAKRFKLKLTAAANALDIDSDQSLFALKSVKTDKSLNQVVDANEPEISSDEEDDQPKEDDDVYDSEDDDAYSETLDQYLEQMYGHYLEKKKKKKQTENEEDNEIAKLLAQDEAKHRNMRDIDDSDEEMEDAPNSLLVKDGELAPSKRTAMWFSQNLFQGISEDDDEEAAILKMKASFMKEQQKKQDLKRKKFTEAATEQEEPVEDEESEDEEDEDEKRKRKKKQKKGFEEVPKQEVRVPDEELDDEEKFTALALGTMIVNNPDMKKTLMDNVYNRYAFSDKDKLPQWFADDEDKHNKPQIPLTKEVVRQIRDRLKEINARPMKKVAEAKARKKMRAARALQKAQSKALAIADSTEMPASEKAKAIEKLYKKAKSPKKKTVLVASKKNGRRVAVDGASTKGARVKLVDKRLKKDLRAQQSKGKKSKGKKR